MPAKGAKVTCICAGIARLRIRGCELHRHIVQLGHIRFAGLGSVINDLCTLCIIFGQILKGTGPVIIAVGGIFRPLKVFVAIGYRITIRTGTVVFVQRNVNIRAVSGCENCLVDPSLMKFYFLCSLTLVGHRNGLGNMIF